MQEGGELPFLPKQAADSCIKRARRFLELAESRSSTRARNDLRRMALVMAVAAIDSYMHALVLRRIADVRKSADLPKALARLEIPFSEIAGLADASIKAQRERRASRPWVQVKASLQQRLLRETFQSFDQVATALAIAGIDKGWSKICRELDETPETNKAWLNDLVHRRNQIVHEGDLKRASRPRRLRFNEISQNDAEQQIDWVEAMITATETVVADHP